MSDESVLCVESGVGSCATTTARLSQLKSEESGMGERLALEVMVGPGARRAIARGAVELMRERNVYRGRVIELRGGISMATRARR